MSYWKPYVPVARRRAQAAREMKKLAGSGMKIFPVEIQGRTIARSFWGKGWCDHLESFSDFENRLPRGRTYARNGSVCHLDIQPGHIEAIVSGSELYNIGIGIKKLAPATWNSIKSNCTGKIGTMLELVQGKFSDEVMKVVTDQKAGLFPLPDEIDLDCDCPDWAIMCKHVAAVLYGVGHRLDADPELLFTLRGVDPGELISLDPVLPEAGETAGVHTLATDALGDIFGVDFDEAEENIEPAPATGKKEIKKTSPKRSRRKTESTKPTEKKKKDAVAQSKKAEKAVAPKKETSDRATLPKIRPTGNSVRRLRDKLGLTVLEFAQEVEMSASTVYRWESTRGRLRLQEKTYLLLALLHKKSLEE